jgi:ribonuclease HI
MHDDDDLLSRIHGPNCRLNLCPVAVFVDGACRSNGMDGAKGGYGVYFAPCSPYNLSNPLPNDGLPHISQRAELTACLVALEQIEDFSF